MKELIEKVSEYKIFNYLFPGVVFCSLAESWTAYQFFSHDIVTDAFVAYFAGMVISRLGSLLLEPFMRFSKIIPSRHYDDFLKAAKSDSKIDVLSEVSNTFRTLTSTIISIIVIYLYEIVESCCNILRDNRFWIMVVPLVFLFGASYRKQATYIVGRIDSAKDSLP